MPDLVMLLCIGGLTVDNNGTLVTVETGVGALPTITHINSSTGELKRVPFDLAATRSPEAVSKPRFIAYHKDEVLIVVDLGKLQSSIEIINSRLCVLFTVVRVSYIK